MASYDAITNKNGETSDTAGPVDGKVTLDTSDILEIPLPRTPLQRIFGISLILGASLIFSGSATASKYLKSIPPGEFVMARGGYAVSTDSCYETILVGIVKSARHSVGV